MKSLGLCFLIVLFVISGCASTKSTQTEIYQLKKLVEQGNFEFIADWAHPRMTNAMSAISNSGLLGIGNNLSMISLQGNNNFIKFKGDTIVGYLPYYGERQFGGSYNDNEITVQFNGVPKKREIKEGKNNSYNISLQIESNKDKIEDYMIFIRIYPNLKTSVLVNSSNRTSIEYTGYSKPIKEEKSKTIQP